MLIELAIKDLVLIERAVLEFGPGLNVITGETGAGKSLLLDALELLLGRRAKGNRAHASLVRKGADRASVEGRFMLPAGGYSDLVRGWLSENLSDCLDDSCEDPGAEMELILARTIGSDGRSRAHVNHRPVTQRAIRELSALMVEVHGQHDHQRLFETSEQLRLIDTFGGLDGVLEGYREHRLRWLSLVEQVDEYETGEAERLQRLDYLRFQAGEFADVEPSLEDHETLLEERATLRHGGELREQLGGLASRLSGSDGSSGAALDIVREAEGVVGRWAERLEDLKGPAAALSQASAYLEEASVSVERFLSGIDQDPDRLDQVEDRLDVLERLQRKHRTDMAGLVARRAQVTEELEALERATDDRAGLVAKLALAREALEESGRRLGKARRALTKRLERAVKEGLGHLGLEQARFSIEYVASHLGDAADEVTDTRRVDRRHFAPHGLERVEFLLAANPGEDPQPLRAVASGGEAARIMLALRGALAVKRSTPTLIFDEVDAGVGGRLGPRVGAHLRDLGEHHQVLCVTHLAPIAAVARRHIRVRKTVSDGRTRTVITPLKGAARVGEIADMIAGGGKTATARAEAERLLKNA
ncbi:MAG: DNA repair protein RecN (Recombination protein N) [Chlamydiales bacterium]|jgi:DNA repair protein RecN (Recombination protein N)